MFGVGKKTKQKVEALSCQRFCFQGDSEFDAEFEANKTDLLAQ